MECGYNGFLSVILLFLKISTLVTGNFTQILGGTYSASELKCHPLLTAYVTGRFSQTGDLVSSDGYVYTKDYYQRYNQTHYRVCICSVRACLRRCCDKGEILSSKTRNCTRVDKEYRIQTDVYTSEDKLIPNYDMSKFYKVYGNTCVNKKFRLDPTEPQDVYYLRYDGTLSVPGMGLIYKTDYFCFEMLVGETQETLEAFACFPENSGNEMDAEYTAYPIGMMISIPFLLATFLVYALIPELRNLHGKNSMCHVASLMTAYIFLVIIQLKSDSLEVAFCIACGFIIQFAFLATFFWLNVMCFDIWYCFSGFRGFGGFKGSTKERECIRFLIYSIYAWGGPALLLIITLVMDLSPNIPDYVLKPHIGKTRCFFDTKMATLAYFYGPMAVLIFANTVLFTLTTIKIFVIRKETQVLSGNESRQNNEANKQRFILYLKLFLIMGINWMCEVISWAVDGPKWIWYITDVCNTLQGLFIFLIFVCKARIKKLIMMRFCPNLLPRDVDTTTSSLKMSMSRNSSVVIGPAGEGNVQMYPVRKTSNEHYK